MRGWRQVSLGLWSLWAQLSNRQIAHPHQVVGGQSEGKHPTHSVHSAMASLAQPANRLEPAENLLDPFALALADCVARVPGGALVDDAALFAREMRRHLMLAQFLHQFPAVVTLVGAQRDPTPARNSPHHRHRRLRFGAPSGLSHTTVNCQAITVLHQHVSGVTELGLLALTLTGQQRLGIGSGLVGVVAASFAMKVDPRVAGILGRRGLRIGVVFAFEALVSRPGLDQGAIDRWACAQISDQNLIKIRPIAIPMSANPAP